MRSFSPSAIEKSCKQTDSPANPAKKAENRNASSGASVLAAWLMPEVISRNPYIATLRAAGRCRVERMAVKQPATQVKKMTNANT